MSDTQQAPDGVTISETPEGIVGFYAETTATRNYVAEKFGIHYTFGAAREYVDVIAKFDEVQHLAEEQAEARLTDRLNRQQAEVAAVTGKPAPQPQAAAPAPKPAPAPAPVSEIDRLKAQLAAAQAAPHPADTEEPPFDSIVEDQLGGQQVATQQAGGLPVTVGTTPKGGQLRYVPTTSLDEQTLRKAIEGEISGHGFDPKDFAIFDNRVTRDGSPYPGLEDGGKSYQVVTIRARNDTPWQAAIGEKTQAFYADFDDAGKLKVKASDKILAALKAQQAFAAS